VEPDCSFSALILLHCRQESPAPTIPKTKLLGTRLTRSKAAFILIRVPALVPVCVIRLVRGHGYSHSHKHKRVIHCHYRFGENCEIPWISCKVYSTITGNVVCSCLHQNCIICLLCSVWISNTIQGTPEKNDPLGKIRYLWNCCRFFRQIYSTYRGRLEPHILRILLQYLVAFKNYNYLNLNVHF